MLADELIPLSARELAAMIRTRRASSREIVTSALDRIDALNLRFNAIRLLQPLLFETGLPELCKSALSRRDAAGLPLDEAGFQFEWPRI